MEDKVLNVVSAVSAQLALEKSYNIPSTCVKYSIGDGADFQG